MKPVLQLLAASALSAGMMLGGVVLASSALAPEENTHHFTGLDIKDLWTSEPVRVDRNSQDLERLPPRYASHVVMNEPAQPTKQAQADEAGSTSLISQIDVMMTASVDNAAETTTPAFSQQHLAWCEARYRSYDPVGNTYRSFSGEQRSCVSPYAANSVTEAQTSQADVINVSEADRETVYDPIDERQAIACMERYRSYRASDNTYQPHGGGPRRTCQLASF